MLCPQAEKWGTRPPRPPPINAHERTYCHFKSGLIVTLKSPYNLINPFALGIATTGVAQSLQSTLVMIPSFCSFYNSASIFFVLSRVLF